MSSVQKPLSIEVMSELINTTEPCSFDETLNLKTIWQFNLHHSLTCRLRGQFFLILSIKMDIFFHWKVIFQ